VIPPSALDQHIGLEFYRMVILVVTPSAENRWFHYRLGPTNDLLPFQIFDLHRGKIFLSEMYTYIDLIQLLYNTQALVQSIYHPLIATTTTFKMLSNLFSLKCHNVLSFEVGVILQNAKSSSDLFEY